MAKAKQLYPLASDFMTYHGNVLFWTGIFTLICAFLGSTIIRSYGWFAAAIVTPLMTVIAGIIFFGSLIFEEHVALFISHFLSYSTLNIIVFMGGVQNVLAKGSKYSLFDTTKEMAYIPLDNEMKTKGKAAVEVMGMKVGKSAAAVTQFIIFTSLPNCRYDDIVDFLAAAFFVVTIVWIYGVIALSKHYDFLLKK